MYGLMSITGPEDGAPVKTGVALTDIATGLFAHGAVLAALYSRSVDGLVSLWRRRTLMSARRLGYL